MAKSPVAKSDFCVLDGAFSPGAAQSALRGVSAAPGRRPERLARFLREQPVQVLPELLHRLVFRLQVTQRPLELGQLVPIQLILALIARLDAVLDVGDAVAQLHRHGSGHHSDLAVGLGLALGASATVTVGACPHQGHFVRVESRMQQVFEGRVGVFQHVVAPAGNQNRRVGDSEPLRDSGGLSQVHAVGVVAVHATVIGGGVAVALVTVRDGKVFLLGLQVHVDRLSTSYVTGWLMVLLLRLPA